MNTSGSAAHEGTHEASSDAALGAESARALFVRGFRGMLPLWAGAIPAGTAYGVVARGGGLDFFETQLMSLVVFSAAAQVGAVALLGAGTSWPVLVGTAMALNAQLLLLSLSVGQQLRLAVGQRLLTAWFLTDGAYGVAVGQGPLQLPILLGAGVSMYAAWNAGTALGAAVGLAIPDPRRLGIDLVAPLCFLAVLVPLVRMRAALVVALVAGAATVPLAQIVPSGVAVLGAGLAGSAVGAWWTRRDSETPARDSNAPRTVER